MGVGGLSGSRGRRSSSSRLASSVCCWRIVVADIAEVGAVGSRRKAAAEEVDIRTGTPEEEGPVGSHCNPGEGSDNRHIVAEAAARRILRGHNSRRGIQTLYREEEKNRNRRKLDCWNKSKGPERTSLRWERELGLDRMECGKTDHDDEGVLGFIDANFQRVVNFSMAECLNRDCADKGCDL